jgi:DNA primase catalytic subunit
MEFQRAVETKRFWNDLFPHAWARVLQRIATSDGLFPLECRELAPRWTRAGGETIMKRHQRYADVVAECQRMRPHALQFGGIHWENGSVLGELVFDVDMDDYDRTNVCACAPGHVCSTCWTTYMEPARVALDWILRKWCEFRKLLHVFSGRRGFHVWVLDRRAVLLTPEQRKALVDRIVAILSVPDELYKGVQAVLTPLARARNMLDWRALFPKLDVQVSRDAGHLKKMPLTIHQDTMRIAVPLPLLTAKHTFDPDRDAYRPHDTEPDWWEAQIRACENVLDIQE